MYLVQTGKQHIYIDISNNKLKKMKTFLSRYWKILSEYDCVCSKELETNDFDPISDGQVIIHTRKCKNVICEINI